MAVSSTVPMAHTEFATGDVDMAHDYLCSTYADHAPHLSGDRDHFRFRASSTREERFGVEFIAQSMELRTVAEPVGDLLVPHVLKGRLAVSTRNDDVRAEPGEELLVPPDTRLAVRWQGKGLGVLRLNTAAVIKYAGELTESRVRFPLSRPVSATRARYWRSVVKHVTREFLADQDALASPLIRAEIFRLLTATLLETFPVVMEETSLRGTVEPGAVRRAIAFIDAHADTDISVTEIAAAARVGPRALQAAFQRHLGITPTAYLRQVRLDRAHLDLQMSDPTKGDTVAAIANTWGFAHHGRFAVAYRNRYGRSPRDTLFS
ncbi:AraC family transcriptional regulator [Actinomadura rudentiformis]|uniref:AraC family transcriptional regulator n=1 Tax=Actinomadura rudentiformis TaxID=359158 RepID=A0A6H9YPF5_9ACTN|nr:AraC family transcriptional regulator [Actinomadura rudentiformis]KAB2348267.1 AraC family transcriptional regulator [Actinomadura rudentiformis]